MSSSVIIIECPYLFNRTASYKSQVKRTLSAPGFRIVSLLNTCQVFMAVLICMCEGERARTRKIREY